MKEIKIVLSGEKEEQIAQHIMRAYMKQSMSMDTVTSICVQILSRSLERIYRYLHS